MLRNWPLGSVIADAETDLVAPAANKEVAIVGLIICNHEAADAASVVVVLTDSANVTLAHIFTGTLEAGEPVHIDTKIFLAATSTPDKIRVTSDKANTSFLASGDEE